MIKVLITARLDYGNFFLYEVAKHILERIQRVQNTAASLVTTSKREHITLILADLHWLPVYFRPQFKILIYMYVHQLLNG